MLGLKIAATCFIVAILSAWLIPDGALEKPRPGLLSTILAWLTGLSFAGIPIGLIVAIWV